MTDIDSISLNLIIFLYDMESYYITIIHLGNICAQEREYHRYISLLQLSGLNTRSFLVFIMQYCAQGLYISIQER